MSGNTKIAWTDATWNPVSGCQKVSLGCKNCYAESIAKRFWGYRKFTDIKLHPERLSEPYKWRNPKMVFTVSMGDLFHEKVPFEFIDNVFDTMIDNPKHTFQILTKRPERAFKYYQRSFCKFEENIWLGTSVSTDQDLNNAFVLDCIKSKVLFISMEPLLEEISIGCFLKYLYRIAWIIVGCESGTQKRPCKIEWIEKIIDDCKRTNVPVFVKQININGKVEKDISKFPKHLRIREFPNQTERNAK